MTNSRKLRVVGGLEWVLEEEGVRTSMSGARNPRAERADAWSLEEEAFILASFLWVRARVVEG